MPGQYEPISVSRRISAPASEIFRLLADPREHLDLDGSGMLRGVASGTVIRGAGDVFVMDMYFDELGDYQMINHVVAYEPGRRIGWEPEAGRGHPNAEPGAARPARWGQRWSFELTPDGPDATIVTEIFDCSGAPAPPAVMMAESGGYAVNRPCLRRYAAAARSRRSCWYPLAPATSAPVSS